MSANVSKEDGMVIGKQKPEPKPTKKMTKAEQSERFITTARELGVDETGVEFERLFKTVVPGGKKKPSRSSDN
jgi:hypothetical protein